MRPISISFLLLALLASPLSAASRGKPARQQHEQMEANTRLQIFLDNANFGPGKIDGQQGEFTQKALALYQQSKGLSANTPSNPKASTNPKAPLDTTGLDLSSVDLVFTTYTVTADDAANVGEYPSGVEAKAKMKRLPYATLAEAVAEKFHCALAFFKQLNPDKAAKLKVGDQVNVPNVKPFVLGEVKGLKPGSAPPEAANDVDESAGDQASQSKESSQNKEAAKESAAGKLSLNVSVKDKMLTVLEDGKVAAAFPVTVGSQQTTSPIGNWTVKAIAKWPTFRWDEKMLTKGERSSHAHVLPPGPNNPVGVIWIALNKKGIGIHGTDDPDDIGRNASHGCIRLANWDITKLAEMIKPGTAVTVE